MKMISRVLMTAVTVAALAAPAMAAGTPKLIVTGADGTTTKFVATDTAEVGVGVTSPLYTFDLSSHGNGTTGSGEAKSLLHFSKDGQDVGGWLTTVADTNFFISAGAVYDNTSGSGGWYQKSPSGAAVAIGGDTPGFTMYTQQGSTVGQKFTLPPRLRISTNGNVGLGVLAPTQVLEVNGGIRIKPTNLLQVTPVTPTPKPTCSNATSATDRGTLWYTLNASTGKDILEICAQDATGATAWRTLY